MTTAFEKFCDNNVHNGEIDVQYSAIGFGGECGEALNYIKKEIRDNVDYSTEIALELGDTLHYLTLLAHYYGYSLNDLMTMNVEKLESRAKAITHG